MKKTILLAAAGMVAALALPAAAKPGNGGGKPDPKPTPVAKGRPGAAKADMTPADGVMATAKIDTKRFPANRGREQREWLRIKARGLTGGSTYSVWLGAMEDSATSESETDPVEVGTLVQDANDDNRWGIRFDNHKAGELPRGDLPLSHFEGQTIEIRVSDGDPLTTTDPVVLTGTVPTIVPKSKPK